MCQDQCAHFPIMKPAAQKGRLNSDSIRLAALSVQNSTKAFQATENVAEYTVSPRCAAQHRYYIAMPNHLSVRATHTHSKKNRQMANVNIQVHAANLPKLCQAGYLQ